MIKKGCFLVSIFCCCCSIAQDSLLLSLSDAIKIGLSQNYDIQLSKKSVEINKVLNSWGEAGRLPTINLSASQDNNFSDQSQNPTSFIQELIQSNSFNGGVVMNWTIFNGFNVKANKIRLEQLVEQSEGTVSLAVENTIHGIILAYFQCKIQREVLSLQKNVLQLSREKYLLQQSKNELGLGVSVDLLQYKSAYLSDSSNFILQELSYKNSMRNLNLFLAVDVERNWLLTEELNPPVKLFAFEDLKQQMLSSNTNIKNQLINVSLLKQDIEIAKSAFYPSLNLVSGGSYNSSKFSIGSMSQNGSSLNYYGNFTLSIRLYDGGKVRRGIKALKVQEEVNLMEIDKLKSNLTKDLAVNFDTYQTRLRVFELNKTSFQVAQQNFDIAKLKENSGLLSSFNLRDVEMAYLSSGITLFQSAYNLIESHTTLLKLTGGIVQDYSSQ
ncbi:MAG: TolC family protein [Bacteroidota bacterium]|nr:TolC family protein [Bacteroidota bacterium]